MQLTNYYDHPEHQLYVVFQFYEAVHADEFEQMIIVEQIEFERYFDQEGKRPRHLFGIHKRYNQKAMHCNNMLHAKHRMKFIPNAWLRYVVLIVTLGMLIVALVGYFLSR